MTTPIAPHRAFRVNTDNSFEFVDFEQDTFLKQAQAIVGGLIQPVDLPPLGITMWVNEEGALENLLVNIPASELLAYAYRPNKTVDIQGNVLFTSMGTDDEGNVLGLQEEMAQSLFLLMKDIKDGE